MSDIKPTTGSERLEVIDALRGGALFGILLANLYSFIGYNTYSQEELSNDKPCKPGVNKTGHPFSFDRP